MVLNMILHEHITLTIFTKILYFWISSWPGSEVITIEAKKLNQVGIGIRISFSFGFMFSGPMGLIPEDLNALG